MEYGTSETTVSFKSKMGGVGVILNYWTQGERLERWIWHPIFLPSTSSLCLCQLRGFLSVVGTMRGWCRHSEGDVLYSDLVQMHPIMIMFCYLYAPPAPVPLLLKSESRKQLQRMLPFSQVFTTLLSHWWRPLFISAALHSQQVCLVCIAHSQKRLHFHILSLTCTAYILECRVFCISWHTHTLLSTQLFPRHICE